MSSTDGPESRLPTSDELSATYVRLSMKEAEEQDSEEHELDFRFDATGHPVEVICSCSKSGRVEME